MDIAGIKPNVREIEITNPGSGAKIGVRVSLVSTDDEKVAKIKREIVNRRMHLEQRGKTFNAEELEENRRRINFATMNGWTWYNPTGKEGDDGYDAEAMPDFNGEVPAFNQKNVFDVLRTLTWFSDQINEALNETQAFFGESKPI